MEAVLLLSDGPRHMQWDEPSLCLHSKRELPTGGVHLSAARVKFHPELHNWASKNLANVQDAIAKPAVGQLLRLCAISCQSPLSLHFQLLDFSGLPLEALGTTSETLSVHDSPEHSSGCVSFASHLSYKELFSAVPSQCSGTVVSTHACWDSGTVSSLPTVLQVPGWDAGAFPCPFLVPAPASAPFSCMWGSL